MSANDVALVVGSGLHALAIARALNRASIPVDILSQGAGLPANATRYARAVVRPDIASDSLVDVLLQHHATYPPRTRAVLFPTSDRMVLAIANAWDRLQDRYFISWSACLDLVKRLQNKAALSELCAEHGIGHPRTIQLHTVEDGQTAASQCGFPLLVKPAFPLPWSGFKTLLVADHAHLAALFSKHAADLPFVAQEWVEGGTDRLHFCSLMAREGETLCSVTGRKLEAIPEAMGIGCVMETCPNPELDEIAREFVRLTRYSGPISIEYKQRTNGEFVTIEPNVGRMEHCVDVVIQSGMNMPLVEFHLALHSPLPPIPASPQHYAVWFDTERDFSCFARACLRTRGRGFGDRRVVFPYFGHGDFMPFAVSSAQQFLRGLREIGRKLRPNG